MNPKERCRHNSFRWICFKPKISQLSVDSGTKKSNEAERTYHYTRDQELNQHSLLFVQCLNLWSQILLNMSIFLFSWRLAWFSLFLPWAHRAFSLFFFNLWRTERSWAILEMLPHPQCHFAQDTNAALKKSISGPHPSCCLLILGLMTKKGLLHERWG